MLALSFASSAAGCASEEVDSGGALRVYLADSQPTLARIEVVVGDVAVRRKSASDKSATATPSDADWVPVNSSQTAPFELGGEPRLAALQLGEGPIPAGNYTAIRLHVVSAVLRDASGVHPLAVGNGYVEAAHLFAYRGAGITELRVALVAGSNPAGPNADSFMPTLTVKSEDRY